MPSIPLLLYHSKQIKFNDTLYYKLILYLFENIYLMLKFNYHVLINEKQQVVSISKHNLDIRDYNAYNESYQLYKSKEIPFEIYFLKIKTIIL